MTVQALATGRAARAADKIDTRILRVLQRDGRISHLKLAEQVHLSPTAVMERVKRLRREGYILGYRARLDPRKLGLGPVAFVEVLLDRTGADVMESFRRAVQERPDILECHLIAGAFDYLLKVQLAPGDDREAFATDVVAGLPGVREARSYGVMDQVKHGCPIAL